MDNSLWLFEVLKELIPQRATHVDIHVTVIYKATKLPLMVSFPLIFTEERLVMCLWFTVIFVFEFIARFCFLQAFVTYLRSVFLMGNKKVFDVHALDIEQYAR